MIPGASSSLVSVNQNLQIDEAEEPPLSSSLFGDPTKTTRQTVQCHSLPFPMSSGKVLLLILVAYSTTATLATDEVQHAKVDAVAAARQQRRKKTHGLQVIREGLKLRAGHRSSRRAVHRPLGNALRRKYELEKQNKARGGPAVKRRPRGPSLQPPEQPDGLGDLIDLPEAASGIGLVLHDDDQFGSHIEMQPEWQRVVDEAGGVPFAGDRTVLCKCLLEALLGSPRAAGEPRQGDGDGGNNEDEVASRKQIFSLGIGQFLEKQGPASDEAAGGLPLRTAFARAAEDPKAVPVLIWISSHGCPQHGTLITKAGSIRPGAVLDRIMELFPKNPKMIVASSCFSGHFIHARNRRMRDEWVDVNVVRQPRSGDEEEEGGGAVPPGDAGHVTAEGNVWPALLSSASDDQPSIVGVLAGILAQTILGSPSTGFLTLRELLELVQSNYRELHHRRLKDEDRVGSRLPHSNPWISSGSIESQSMKVKVYHDASVSRACPVQAAKNLETAAEVLTVSSMLGNVRAVDRELAEIERTHRPAGSPRAVVPTSRWYPRELNVAGSTMTALAQACENGDEELVQKLVSYGASANQVYEIINYDDEGDGSTISIEAATPLLMVLEPREDGLAPQDVAVIKRLLEGGADPNGASKAVRSRVPLMRRMPIPLVVACSRGHAAVVDLLLRHGADANLAADPSGVTPLMAAVAAGCHVCVGLLSKRAKTLDLTAKTAKAFRGLRSGQTALDIANLLHSQAISAAAKARTGEVLRMVTKSTTHYLPPRLS